MKIKLKKHFRVLIVVSTVQLLLISVALVTGYYRQAAAIRNLDIIGDWVWEPKEFFDTESGHVVRMVIIEPERKGFWSITDSTIVDNWGDFLPYRIEQNFIHANIIIKKNDSIMKIRNKITGDREIKRIVVNEWDTIPLFQIIQELREHNRLLPKTQLHFDSILFISKGCYGACPLFSMMIHSDRRVFFYGERYTEKQGYYSGVLTQSQSESILKKYQQVDFDNIDSEYGRGWVDAHSCNVILYHEEKKRIIYVGSYDDYDGPVEFGVLLHYLMELYKWIDLKEVPPFEIASPSPSPPELKPHTRFE
ncbi:MAG: DUF6438 domain-containing protein [Dysgonamonadaceae bacterium]|jgi:hypothetical protein|nr:DUF6438 domain-containing protein [Dysgonamonadaceae bacterium]